MYADGRGSGALEWLFFFVGVCGVSEAFGQLCEQVELGRRAIEVMHRLEKQRQQPVTPNSRDLQVRSLYLCALQR